MLVILIRASCNREVFLCVVILLLYLRINHIRMENNTDLFGNKLKPKKVKNFNDYKAFVEKFEPKKTTDDCYTPEKVYYIILEYVSGFFDLSGKEILRPFYPNGDYESIDYKDNQVVIDNPPFSIISKIARFYIARNIPFFLFSPHLTLFGSDIDCTKLVVGADIVYTNGALVKTSFLSNMLGNYSVIADHELYNKLEAINKENKANLPKYQYPENVLTVSMLALIVSRGVSIKIDKGELAYCRGLESQKVHKKAIFGSGFLLSEKAAAEKAAAEKLAAEKDNIITWGLSDRERKIIESLGK